MDTFLTLPLELMLLTVVVGAGALHFLRTRLSAASRRVGAAAYDMRFDGQMLIQATRLNPASAELRGRYRLLVVALAQHRQTSAWVSASTGNAWPEMFAPSGDARNTIAFAISSALTIRRSDALAIISSRTTSGATPRNLALLV